MKEHMELSRRTWTAAIKLAAVISIVAAFVAIIVSTLGGIPDTVIVAVVAIVGFTTSWVQTGRVQNTGVPAHAFAMRR